jgi:hypothetical protein
MYAEYGRMLGILLKGSVVGRLSPYPAASLLVLLGLVTSLSPELMSTLILVGILPRHLDNIYFTSGFYFFLGLIVLYFVRHILSESRSH